MNSEPEAPPRQNRRLSPLRVVSNFALIAAGGLIFGLVLPSLTAIASGVFFRASMEAKLRTIYPDVIRRLEISRNKTEGLQREIAQIDNLLVYGTNAGRDDRTSLLSLRSTYKHDLKAKPSVSIQPLYQHIIMYFWPIMYTCLGSLIFLLYPRMLKASRPKLIFRNTLSLATGIFIFTTWPLVLRNLFARSEADHRIVYAYSNIDVDLPSFCVQLTNFAIFSILLAVIWRQWSAFFVNLQSRSWIKESHIGRALDRKSLRQITTLLLHAQAAIIVLSIPFMIYTSIFWTQIITLGDLRFLFEAITAHIIWLITLLLILLPFSSTWMRWRSQKQSAILDLVYAPNSEDPNVGVKLSMLQDLRPIGSWNLVASGFAVLSSLVVPIVQAIIK